ncbi:AraC family transcriptional regulator ligand-binding domain-containing protein [Marinomonas sp. THO17]|uniref:AraC family transcriptional regulator n=1 Tax=Marinomonas sp. THO17 TaxID=3149048 RepID=UPI00336C1184
MQKCWLERHDAYLFAHQQAVILMDLLISRGVEANYFLRKTGLFYDDVTQGKRILSPQQLAQLFDNASQPPFLEDISFIFGQRMLPGYFDSLSHCLQNSPTTLDALERLCEFACLFFPLLTPRLRQTPSHVFIEFQQAFGAISPSLLSSEQSRATRFVKEMTITALVSYSNWLANTHLPWSISLDYAQPDHQAEYEVYLGRDRRFNGKRLSMSIAKQDLIKANPMSSPSMYKMSLTESRRALQQLDAPHSLLSLIHSILHKEVRNLPSLEDVARRLNMSPATFKRKLKRHHTHYQKLCDQVRKEVAMQLMDELGYDEGQVANYFNFYDVSNFRRSCRRWFAY